VKDFLNENEQLRLTELLTLIRYSNNQEQFKRYNEEFYLLLETAGKRAVSYFEEKERDDNEKKHNKDWEEIDRIADENGGRYCGPTFPGEADTSEVSIFIQESLKERFLYGKDCAKEGSTKGENLLTQEEKAIYFQIKARLLQADLNNDLSGYEYKRLYEMASNVLLGAVERECVRRGLP
jgi:hypothetical protein